MTHQWDPCRAVCVVCGISEVQIALRRSDPGCNPDTRCVRCGVELRIGDWPFCPHGRAQPTKGFEPHFDIGLGREVTGWGDVRKAMREQRLDFRDHPTRERTARYYDRARRARESRP